MFRDDFPTAWAYHANTSRWPFNVLDPEEVWAGPMFKEYPESRFIALPEPADTGVTLSKAIRQRVSCRAFLPSSLSLRDLSTLLFLTYGIQGVAHYEAKELLERPVPSGGGLYPLEFYLVARHIEGLTAGVYHYAPLNHGLEFLHELSRSDGLISQLFMNQPYICDAGAIVLISAVVVRTMHKYADRGYRYILLEAGHAAQNFSLSATALGLGTLPLGGFFDAFVGDLLAIDVEQEPLLYGLALGKPRTSDRLAVRNINLPG
ncbi:MAG TPA: SagB/ThcOx family dehydrogenase [Burkholderiaceae bacterium]|nr:SagB/ThcOx family dehydrogenase [Burkholderiaceae bacterium]